jgi:hypothetical protein
VQKGYLVSKALEKFKVHHLYGLLHLLEVVWQLDLDARYGVDRGWVKHDWHDSKSTILLFWVSGLAQIITCQPILDIEVDIEDVVDLVLLDYLLELSILLPHLLHILWIQSLLLEAN